MILKAFIGSIQIHLLNQFSLQYISDSAILYNANHTSGGSQCSLCPGSALDHLSHHTVTCKHGGDVVTRHYRLHDCSVEVCCRAHIGVRVEVGNNLTPSHSKTRPADILIPNWVMGRTAALDVSVTSLLNP